MECGMVWVISVRSIQCLLTKVWRVGVAATHPHSAERRGVATTVSGASALKLPGSASGSNHSHTVTNRASSHPAFCRSPLNKCHCVLSSLSLSLPSAVCFAMRCSVLMVQPPPPIYIYKCIYTCAHSSVYTCLYMYICIHTRTVSAYIHTHTHTIPYPPIPRIQIKTYPNLARWRDLHSQARLDHRSHHW